MEALLYFVGAAVLAIPTTALICRARLARQRRASFGTVLSGAAIAALIAYIGILIYVGGADVFTAAFWNDSKQSPTLGRFLLGWLGTALPCALVALAVVAYYQSRRKHEKDGA